MEHARMAGAASDLELRLDEGFLSARDGLRLYWRSMMPRDPRQIRARVAIVHGYCDHSGRYREAMERLAARGYAAHAFDLRGHGQSEGRRTYCETFADYVADVDAFVEMVRRASAGQRLFLMGHSLGGLIALRWLLGRKNSLAGLVLSAPFLGFAFRPPAAKVVFARVANRVWPWVRLGNGLGSDQLTRDLELQRATDQDPLYQHTATPRWFVETERAQRDVLRRADELALPCLVLAGSRDPIADSRLARQFTDRVASADRTFKLYPDVLHEPLNDVGREQVMTDLLGWLEAHR